MNANERKKNGEKKKLVDIIFGYCSSEQISLIT